MVKAWIVAIEKYALGLDIPAEIGKWAVDLADFLVKKAGVSAGNIVVNISARDGQYASQLAALGIAARGATQSDLKEVPRQLTGEPNDFLLIYWVGHGIRDSQERYLLCADSRLPGDLNSLTVNSLVKYLRAPQFPGIQMGFFDACAQHHETPNNFNFGEPEPGVNRQFYFFAASANEFAAVDPDSAGFSNQILKRLRSSGRLPIADPRSFFDDLTQAFEDMHTAGTLQSRPFDLSYTKGGDLWSVRLGRKERILVDPQSIYLYDRSPQAEGLVELIHDRDDRAHRPLAFIVSGPEPECHDALHERLTKLPLPNSLLGSRHAANRLRALPLPSAPSLLASTTEKVVRDYLRAPLEARDRNAKSILGHLEPGLTYIRAMVNARSSLGASEKVIKALLNILNNPEQCPDLPDDQALCVGISLYWGKDDPGEATQEHMTKAFSEDDYEALRFRVLPDLESPRKEHATPWTTELDSLYPGRHSPTKWAALGRVVAGLFDKEHMTMLDLEAKFTKLFE